MDPEDFPTTLILKNCRSAKTPEAFRKKFFEAICDHHHFLPFDRFCTSGGAGDDVEDEELEIDDFTKEKVTGTYGFSFVESYYGGCRDIELSDRHRASLDFTFIRKTGELELSGGTAERIYDPEEL